MVEVLPNRSPILNAKVPPSLGTTLNFMARKGEEKTKEISSFLNFLLQSTESISQVENFPMR